MTSGMISIDDKKESLLLINPDLKPRVMLEDHGIVIENALQKAIAMDLITGDGDGTPEGAALEGLIDSLQCDLEIMSRTHALYFEKINLSGWPE